MSTHPATSRRVIDLVLYVSIGGVLALALYLYASGDGDIEALSKWGGLTVNTALLFGYMISQSREFWNRSALWWTILVAFLVHTAVFLVLFRSIEHWRLIWFVGMYPIEIPLIALGCDLALGHSRGKAGQGKQG